MFVVLCIDTVLKAIGGACHRGLHIGLLGGAPICVPTVVQGSTDDANDGGSSSVPLVVVPFS